MTFDMPKFICTIGPSTMSKEMIKKMYDAGMSHIRFNMSYRLDYYDDVVNKVKELNEEFGINIGIICDLAGTEMRVEIDEELEVKKGQQIIIGKDIKLDQGDLSLLNQGDEIIIKDGKVVLKVDKYEDGLLYCTSQSDSVINVNGNCFNKTLYENLPFISNKDKLNLEDAIRYGVDYIAVSHVRSKESLIEIENYLKERNANIKLMSKIENGLALKNLDEIIEYSDGIMIPRGCLGKIVPIEEIGYNQKLITKKTLEAGKFLLSATDYLFSLIEPTTPTRAEVIDLFTAYSDGIRNIMFTKEISLSKDPIYLLNMATNIFKSYVRYEEEVNNDK